MRTLSYLVLLLSCLVARGQATLYNSNIKLAQVNGPRYTNVTSGLVGWWKFDEGSGTASTADSAGSNTGFLTNSPTWVLGVMGKALDFNGTNQCVGFTNAVTLGTGDYTYNLWVKSTNNSAGKICFIFGDQSTANGSSYIYNSDDTHIQQGYWTQHPASTSSAAVYDGKWHMLTASKTNGWMGFYVDGTNKISDATIGVVNLVHAPPYCEIGAFSTTFWKGSIDDVRIYNRALDSTEVLNLYNWRP